MNDKKIKLEQKTEQLTEMEALQIQVIDLKMQALNRESQDLNKDKNKLFELIAQRIGKDIKDILNINYTNKIIYLR